MSKEYSEDKLIQETAADLLEKELGWHHICTMPKLMSTEIEVQPNRII